MKRPVVCHQPYDSRLHSSCANDRKDWRTGVPVEARLCARRCCCRGTCRARLVPWRSMMALRHRSTGGCMTTTNHETAEVHAGQALPTANDIRDIIERKKKDKLADEIRLRKAAEEKLAELKKEFDARKLTPESIDRVMSRSRRAADNGEYVVLSGQVPSEWCRDGGHSSTGRV